METIKKCKNVEFDVIYDDGSRKRVQEGVLYEATVDGDIIFHNGTSRLEVLTAAAEKTLVSLLTIGSGLEILAMGMVISDESRDALVRLAKFANDLLNIDSAEKQACFCLGQKDMQLSVIDLLSAAGKSAGGVVGATLLVAADLVRGLEVEGNGKK